MRNTDNTTSARSNRDLGIDNQRPAKAGHTSPLAAPTALTEEDIGYLEAREKVVTNSVRVSIAAARALHEIATYEDGKLWKGKHRSFADYCARKWGFRKSYSYMLLDTGGFIADLEAGQSTRVENLPVNEGQVRPLLVLVPKEYRIECWDSIVAEKAPAELSGPTVRAKAKEFLKGKGLPIREAPKRTSQAAALGELDKLRKALATLPEPNRFDQLLESIATLINQNPEDAVVDVVAEAAGPIKRESIPVASPARLEPREPSNTRTTGKASGGLGSSRLTASSHTRGQNPKTPSAETSVSAPFNGNQDLQERVAQAMDDDPPDRTNVTTVISEPDQNVIDDGCHSSVTTVTPQVRITPATPVSVTDNKDFMSARIFHQLLHPGGDYTKWLAATATSHPRDIINPDDGAEARISLMRARNIAYGVGDAAATEFKLVCKAQNSGDSDPGSVADALFTEYVRALEVGAPVTVHLESRALSAYGS